MSVVVGSSGFKRSDGDDSPVLNVFNFDNVAEPNSDNMKVFTRAGILGTAIINSNVFVDAFCAEVQVTNSRFKDNVRSASRTLQTINVLFDGKNPGHYYFRLEEKTQGDLKLIARTIYMNPALMNSMNVNSDPSLYSERINKVVSLMAAKLVREISCLLCYLLMPVKFFRERNGTFLLPIKNNTNNACKQFGNRMECVLFGGVIQFVSWLDYNHQYKGDAYEFDLCFQYSDYTSSGATFITSVEQFMTLPITTESLQLPTGLCIMPFLNKRKREQSNKRKRESKIVIIDGVRYGVIFD